jgi:hypothetical protein
MISRDNRTPNDGVVPCPNVGDSREADHARNRPGSCDRCCEHVRRLDGATPCSPLHGVAPVDIGRGVVLEAIGWTGPVQPFFIPLLDGAPGRTGAPVKQSGRSSALVRRAAGRRADSRDLTVGARSRDGDERTNMKSRVIEPGWWTIRNQSLPTLCPTQRPRTAGLVAQSMARDFNGAGFHTGR